MWGSSYTGRVVCGNYLSAVARLEVGRLDVLSPGVVLADAKSVGNSAGSGIQIVLWYSKSKSLQSNSRVSSKDINCASTAGSHVFCFRLSCHRS